MKDSGPFVDIHCHLLPGIDDGAKSWDESLAMARMAVADGIETIVLTPHQLGGFEHNSGDLIRRTTKELQRILKENEIPLQVFPGADVRIENDLAERLQSGEVLTLADRNKYVLLELPHELYFTLEPLLEQLRGISMTGILTHPERNQGLLKQPGQIEALVQGGCLMQITAGSLLGAFGPQAHDFSQWMLSEGLVHFVATDAHGVKSRRPLMRRAHDRVANFVDEEMADIVCRRNPSWAIEGREIPPGRLRKPPRRGVLDWLLNRNAA